MVPRPLLQANDWKIDPCGTISITIGDGGNTEGLSSQFVDTPGQCTTPAATYYFRGELAMPRRLCTSCKGFEYQPCDQYQSLLATDLCNTPPAGFGGALFAGGNYSGFCPLSGKANCCLNWGLTS